MLTDKEKEEIARDIMLNEDSEYNADNEISYFTKLVNKYTDRIEEYRKNQLEKDFNKITLTIDLMTCRDNQVENLKKIAESYFKQKGINLSKYQVKYTHCDSDQASDPDFKHDSED